MPALVRIVTIGFCLLLFLVPLPFGANRQWSASLLAGLSGVMLAAYAWFLTKQPEWSPKNLRQPVLVACCIYLVVLLWAWLQTVGFTPNSWHHPLWNDAAKALAVEGTASSIPGAISVDPGVSQLYILRLAGYACVFLLAFLLAHSSDQARLLHGVIIGASVFYALYGLMVELMGIRLVLWYEKTAYINNLTSVFINRNSYATFAGLGLIASVAFVVRRWRRGIVSSDPKHPWQGVVQNILGKELAWIVLPLVIFTALMFAESRAGFTSTFAGLLVFVLAYAINQRLKPRHFLLIVLFLCIPAGVLVAYGGHGLIERLQNGALETDVPNRLEAYALTWEAIKANPLLGYGLGNFDSVFRLFRDETIQGWFHRAHNDWLETMLDLGIPAALAFWSCLFIMVGVCIRGILTRQRDGIYACVALAVSVQVGLHSLIDFSLQIPAVTATYAALLGVGVAQSWSSRRDA